MRLQAEPYVTSSNGYRTSQLPTSRMRRGRGGCQGAHAVVPYARDSALDGATPVTLWVCSTENLKRSRAEVSGSSERSRPRSERLLRTPRFTSDACGSKPRAASVSSHHPRSPSSARQKGRRLYDAMILTIAVAYGGREEIVDAVRDLIRAKARDGAGLDELAEHITPAAIDQHLYTVGLPDPDLIIRTSGEVRLSGFLLWQSVQSQFYFTDVYWPEFRKVDFLRAIRSFQQRTRRFGQ